MNKIALTQASNDVIRTKCQKCSVILLLCPVFVLIKITKCVVIKEKTLTKYPFASLVAGQTAISPNSCMLSIIY